MVKVDGGTLTQTGSYTVGGTGEVCPIWTATSEHTGESLVFWTKGLAMHWLWAINETFLSRKMRLG